MRGHARRAVTVEGDLGPWWGNLVDPARNAVRDADLSRVVDSPIGTRRIGDALSFPAIDLFVHARDVGRATGVDVVIPADVIEFSHAVTDPIPAEQIRSPRVFATGVATGPDATSTQSFIAWTGRDPQWQSQKK